MPDWTFTTGKKRAISDTVVLSDNNWTGQFFFIVALDCAYEGAAFGLDKVVLGLDDENVRILEDPQKGLVTLQIVPLSNLA